MKKMLCNAEPLTRGSSGEGEFLRIQGKTENYKSHTREEKHLKAAAPKCI